MLGHQSLFTSDQACPELRGPRGSRAVGSDSSFPTPLTSPLSRFDTARARSIRCWVRSKLKAPRRRVKILAFSVADSSTDSCVSRQRAHHLLPSAVDIGSRAKFLVALTALRCPNRSVSKYGGQTNVRLCRSEGPPAAYTVGPGGLSGTELRSSETIPCVEEGR